MKKTATSLQQPSSRGPVSNSHASSATANDNVAAASADSTVANKPGRSISPASTQHHSKEKGVADGVVDGIGDSNTPVFVKKSVVNSSSSTGVSAVRPGLTETITNIGGGSGTPEAVLTREREAYHQGAFQAKMVLEECYALRGRVRNLSDRIKGPVGAETDRNTALPMVFLLGNHSSGKSSFINYVLQCNIQDCGVAPTDDKFTVITGGDEDADKDGNSLIGDPNLGFSGLKSFGPSLVHHTQLKLRKDVSVYDIMFVDSPGMIDSPDSPLQPGGADSKTYDRGYDFGRVVKWFAERADVILLFFDPDKPGTTGETLSIMTNSLMGMDNKLHIVLNKVDQFDKIHDFARVYGSLCWNLSKVIPRKDLPPIYPMCLPNRNTNRHDHGVDSHGGGSDGHNIFADDLANTKDVIVKEILSAPYKRVDNEIQRLYDSMFALQMHSKILNEMVSRYSKFLWGFRGKVFVATITAFGISGGVVANRNNMSQESTAGVIVSSLAALFGFHWWQASSLQANTTALLRDPNVVHDIYETVYDESIAICDESVASVWPSVLARMQIKISPDDLTKMGRVDTTDLDLIDKILNTNIYKLREQLSPNLPVAYSSRSQSSQKLKR